MKKPSNSGSARQLCPTCPHCCCVTSVTILPNIRPTDNTGEQIQGVQAANGHVFQVKIDMNHQAGTQKSECILIWNEKTNIPLRSFIPPNQWVDYNKYNVDSPTFAPWKDRTIPANGGPSSVTITDVPGLGPDPPTLPGRQQWARDMQFDIRVKSGPDCKCPSGEKGVKARQIMTVTDGKASGTFDPNATEVQPGK